MFSNHLLLTQSILKKLIFSMYKVYKIFDIVESDLHHTFIINSLIFISKTLGKFSTFQSIAMIAIIIYT